MKIFDLFNTKEECCSSDTEFVNTVEGCESKNIIVVGSSCCKSGYNLYEKLKQIIKETNVAAKLTYTDSIESATEYGIISKPSIVINDKVIALNNGIDDKGLKELLSC